MTQSPKRKHRRKPKPLHLSDRPPLTLLQFQKMHLRQDELNRRELSKLIRSPYHLPKWFSPPTPFSEAPYL